MPFTGFSINEGQDTREAQRPAWQLEETRLLGFGSQGLNSSKIRPGIGIWANEKEVTHVIGGVNAPQGREEKLHSGHIAALTLVVPLMTTGERNNTKINATICHFTATSQRLLKAIFIIDRLQDPAI